jgi:uncharacterized membrane protein YhaH (DUF805 family)
MDDIDWGYLFFQFDGRINRAKFWLGIVGLYAALWVLIGIAFATESGALISAVSLLWIAALWPGLAIAIKRWHDRNKSGWWVLIALVPLIGPIWALIETGFLAGTEGPNQYGPDPLAAPAIPEA